MGITDAGDVVFTQDRGEAVYVWKDGNLTLLPNPSPGGGYSARAVAPAGAILRWGRHISSRHRGLS